jgi:hypothetical protein
MRRIAISLAAMDFLLIFAWFGGSIYLARQFHDGDPCYRGGQTLQHFVILFHFALGMFITNVASIITLERERVLEHGRRLITLSYATYYPLTWIFTGVVALLGDITLLTWAALEYEEIVAHEPECRNAQVAHITFDSFALLVSLLVVLWFILFSAFRTRHKTSVPLDK